MTETQTIRGVPVELDGDSVTLAREMVEDDELEVVVHPDYDNVFHLPHEQNAERPAPLCRPIEYQLKARAPLILVSQVDRKLCNHCQRYVLDELL